MKLTEEQIREALKQVIDPEVGLNIIDMGLVYKIDISEKAIDVYMTLTTQGCPMGEYILDNTKQAIQAMPDAPPEVHVGLVWDPAWTPEMMNQEALAQRR